MFNTMLGKAKTAGIEKEYREYHGVTISIVGKEFPLLEAKARTELVEIEVWSRFCKLAVI